MINQSMGNDESNSIEEVHRITLSDERKVKRSKSLSLISGERFSFNVFLL